MRRIALLVGLVVGLVAMVGVAIAGTPYTLDVFKSTVTNTHHVSTTENIVGASGGFPVYMHSGDSKRHPKCLSKRCRTIWPWVTIANGETPTESPLIKKNLGVWKHNGVSQLTLGGHPLFFHVGDSPTKHQARGDGIVSFGGTWHVWKISSSSQGGGPTTGPTFLGSSFSGSQPGTEDFAVSPKEQINGIELSTASGSKITVHFPPPGGTCTDPAINIIKCTFPPISGPFTMSINFFTPTFPGLMGAVSSDGGNTWGPTSTFTHQGQ